MPRIAELLQELEQEAPTTRRVLARIPDEHLGWKPHQKSMPLGQLAMHVAELPGGISHIASWSEFDVGIDVPRQSPASTEQLLAAFDESLLRARNALGNMDDDSLATPWRLVNGQHEIMTISRGQLLRTILFNHMYHHRGQLCVYLRQIGVPVPPVFGPSADEDPFDG